MAEVSHPRWRWHFPRGQRLLSETCIATSYMYHRMLSGVHKPMWKTVLETGVVGPVGLNKATVARNTQAILTIPQS
jgi:hypothetical protein